MFRRKSKTGTTLRVDAYDICPFVVWEVTKLTFCTIVSVYIFTEMVAISTTRTLVGTRLSFIPSCHVERPFLLGSD